MPRMYHMIPAAAPPPPRRGFVSDVPRDLYLGAQRVGQPAVRWVDTPSARETSKPNNRQYLSEYTGYKAYHAIK